MSDCPCGSGLAFCDCCEPYISGKLVPATAEQAMRSRYSAYTRVDTAYLAASLHPSKKQEDDEKVARRWAMDSEWLGLEILSTLRGGPNDDEGVVEFVARYRTRNGQLNAHHEVSTFVKEDGRWLFTEGHAPEQHTERRASPKVGRNETCPCGSGKKYKKCCEKA